VCILNEHDRAAPRTTPTLTGRAATMAATKYSETMLTALCVMAHEGRISTIIRTSTVVALMNRAAIVTPTGHYPSGAMVQLTDAGWAALPVHEREHELSAAHDAALVDHQDRMTTARGQFAAHLAMLAAPAGATWHGGRHGEYRSGLDAEADYAMTTQDFGPWFGLDRARHGIVDVIESEMDHMTDRRHVDDAIVVRLRTLADRFRSDPTCLSATVD